MKHEKWKKKCQCIIVVLDGYSDEKRAPRRSDRRKWAPLSLAPGGLTWSYASLQTGKVSESVCLCVCAERQNLQQG